jgi:hypothetical protein
VDATASLSRAVTIVGLSRIGLIDLLDSVDTYDEARWLFWAYVALMASTIVVAGALLHRPEARWLAAAALFAAMAMAGLILSRSTGLPGADDDIGAWTDPLALRAATRHAFAPRRPLAFDSLKS